MRMIEIATYGFAELGDAVKKQVLDKHRDINVNYNEWDSHVLYEWNEKLLGKGFEDSKITYSGFHTQGSKATFTANFSIGRPIPDHVMAALAAEKLSGGDILVREDMRCQFYGKIKDGRVYHMNPDDPNRLGSWAVGRWAEEVSDEIHEEVKILCGDIFDDLQTEYDYQTSDERVIETIECNDYRFDINGKLV